MGENSISEFNRTDMKWVTKTLKKITLRKLQMQLIDTKHDLHIILVKWVTTILIILVVIHKFIQTTLD